MNNNKSSSASILEHTAERYESVLMENDKYYVDILDVIVNEHEEMLEDIRVYNDIVNEKMYQTCICINCGQNKPCKAPKIKFYEGKNVTGNQSSV